MSDADVIAVCREAILVMIWVSAPFMLITMITGLLISLFQALTQIQEQTLTFVPKMLLVFGAAVFLAPFVLSQLTTFTHNIADRIIGLGAS
jgi:flagellar biosynthetic protein FliQ